MLNEPEPRGHVHKLSLKDARTNVNQFLKRDEVIKADELPSFIEQLKGQSFTFSTASLTIAGETSIGARINNQDRIGYQSILLPNGARETLVMVVDGNDQLEEIRNGGTFAARLTARVMAYTYQQYRLAEQSRQESLIQARMAAREAIRSYAQRNGMQGRIDACVSAIAIGEDRSYTAIGAGDTTIIQVADTVGPILPIHNWAYLDEALATLPDTNPWIKIKRNRQDNKLKRDEVLKVYQYFATPYQRMQLLNRARNLANRNEVHNGVVDNENERDVSPVSIHEGHIPLNATFLLCSDGFWEMGADNMIRRAMQQQHTPESLVNELVAAAEAQERIQRANDNIALVAVKLNETRETSTPTLRRPI